MEKSNLSMMKKISREQEMEIARLNINKSLENYFEKSLDSPDFINTAEEIEILKRHL